MVALRRSLLGRNDARYCADLNPHPSDDHSAGMYTGGGERAHKYVVYAHTDESRDTQRQRGVAALRPEAGFDEPHLLAIAALTSSDGGQDPVDAATRAASAKQSVADSRS
jgi:hypothetical protein